MHIQYGLIPYHFEGCNCYEIRSKDPMLMRPIEERKRFFYCGFGCRSCRRWCAKGSCGCEGSWDGARIMDYGRFGFSALERMVRSLERKKRIEL
jgi:hypothetical protein